MPRHDRSSFLRAPGPAGSTLGEISCGRAPLSWRLGDYPARRGLTVRRLRVNRKPLRNCASLAQPSRARNRVYSLPGHLFALATLPYFRRFLGSNRAVLPWLTAAIAFWLSLPTPSNIWRLFFGEWLLILASICMLRIAVCAAQKRGMTLNLEPLCNGMFRC